MVIVDLLIAYRSGAWSTATVELPGESMDTAYELLQEFAIDKYISECGSLRHIAHILMTKFRSSEEEEQA